MCATSTLAHDASHFFRCLFRNRLVVFVVRAFMCFLCVCCWLHVWCVDGDHPRICLPHTFHHRYKTTYTNSHKHNWPVRKTTHCTRDLCTATFRKAFQIVQGYTSNIYYTVVVVDDVVCSLVGFTSRMCVCDAVCSNIGTTIIIAREWCPVSQRCVPGTCFFFSSLHVPSPCAHMCHRRV